MAERNFRGPHRLVWRAGPVTKRSKYHREYHWPWRNCRNEAKCDAYGVHKTLLPVLGGEIYIERARFDSALNESLGWALEEPEPASNYDGHSYYRDDRRADWRRFVDAV